MDDDSGGGGDDYSQEATARCDHDKVGGASKKYGWRCAMWLREEGKRVPYLSYLSRGMVVARIQNSFYDL
jgi:hypothetical protein